MSVNTHSLILYGTPVRSMNSHCLVTRQRFQPEYYVRAVMVPGDCAEAFDKAIPEAGEVVLNTVPVTGQIPSNPLRKDSSCH